jgi:hypothetical protein
MNKIISLLLIIIVVATAASCNLGNRYKTTDSEYDHQKAEVKEVIQTSNYTYLRVEKKDLEQWIAIGKMEVKEGEVIYFEDGLEMTNFESPELGRTFESVLFVQEISNEPIKHDGMHGGMPGGMGGGKGGEVMGDKPEKPVFEKLDIKVDQPEGGTSIGNLYARRADYSGKLVTVRGQVTKVNVGIMSRNWVHIQDGTADGENFDLTITTDDEPAMGTVVTYYGTLSLKKDFGYGYYYEIILENAEPVKVM